TVALYWAKGETAYDILTEAYSKPLIVGTVAGPYQVNVPISDMKPIPQDATRLLLVLDHADVVAESDEDNNLVSTRLYQVKDTSVIVPTIVGDEIDELANRFIDETDKVFVITDGNRTPADQAIRILNTIHSEGVKKTKQIYNNGPSINEILAAYN